MKNYANELYSILMNVNSQLLEVDTESSLFQVLLHQLTDVLTALQNLENVEKLTKLMYDTSSDALRDTLEAHLKVVIK